MWRAAGSDAGTEKVWTLNRSLGITFGYLSEVFSHVLGRKPTLTRKGIIYSSMTRYYNIGKAKRVLRYKPLYTLQEGIERGVRWFLEQEK